MGIGRKVLTLNITLSILSVILIFIIGHQIWNIGYLKLEEDSVHGNASRAYQAWNEEIDVLSSVVSDWAPWDEMYEFAKQPWNDEFVEKNLDDAMMANFKINMVVIANPKGEIVYSKAIKIDKQNKLLTPEEIAPHVKKISNLLPEAIARENNSKGFIMLPEYPVLVSAQRISTSEFKGPSPGILILIRKADEEYVKQIAKRVQIDMLFSANYSAVSDTNQGYWQQIIDEQQVKGYQRVTDIYGNNAYLLETTMSRDIYQQGQHQMSLYAIVTLLFGIGLSIITLMLLENLALKRLRMLDEFMKNIVKGEDVTKRLQLLGNDEVSRTAAIMNSMLDRVQESQERLKQLSFYDGLTGLYNRAFFKQQLKQVSNSNAQSIGVIICDVDGLKFINDTLGHFSGDELLIEMADVLKSVFQNEEKIVRMGGDEFLVLLTNVSKEYIEKSCQRISERLQQVNMFRSGFKLGVSVGWEYSDIQPMYRESILAVVKKADYAMYRKKLASSSEKRRLMMQEVLRILDHRDYCKEGHGERLAAMTVCLGEAAGLPETTLDKLEILSRFHDVGKVGIADEIIFKNGALTTEERIEMERHTEIGYRIAQAFPELMPIADLILKHHEWWNGQGYPIGLQGLAIPIENRIFSIVDAYDEMTSDRPSHKAMTESQAVAELQRLSGIQFDPELVTLFITVVVKSCFIVKKQSKPS